MIEHPEDARLDVVRQEVTGVNSELANTQRDLVRERARLAHAQVDRMRAMIDGVLAYARSGRMRVSTETVDSAAVVPGRVSPATQPETPH